MYNVVAITEKRYHLSPTISYQSKNAYGKLYDDDGNIKVSANIAYILRQCKNKQYPISKYDLNVMLENCDVADLIPEEETKGIDIIKDALSSFKTKITHGIVGTDYLVLTFKSKNSAKKVCKRMKFKKLNETIEELNTNRNDMRVAITWKEN